MLNFDYCNKIYTKNELKNEAIKQRQLLMVTGIISIIISFCAVKYGAVNKNDYLLFISFFCEAFAMLVTYFYFRLITIVKINGKISIGVNLISLENKAYYNDILKILIEYDEKAMKYYESIKRDREPCYAELLTICSTLK